MAKIMTEQDIADLMWGSTALGVSFFAFCAVLIRRVTEAGPAVYLDAMAVFLLVCVLDSVDDIVFGSPIHAPHWLEDWPAIFIPAFMPSLWFFVRGLTEPAMHLRRRDAWHLVPWVLGGLLLGPWLALPGEIKADIPTGMVVSDQWMQLAELGDMLFWAGWIVMLICYGFACARRLQRHKRTIRELFSDVSGKELWWLDALVATILTLAWAVMVDEILQLAGHSGFMSGTVEGLHGLALAFFFGLFAIRAKPPLPDWSVDFVTPSDHNQPSIQTDPTVVAEATKDVPERYARSGLAADDLDRLAKRLKARTEAERLWEDPMLNLKSLADATGIAPIHLSEVLNTHVGQSFFDFINGLRVDAACKLLSETDMGVLEISETVGYNSKSTFNANFKRITNQTPTQWRATIRAMAKAPQQG